MKCACPIAAAALVISLSSFAKTPLAVTAELCPDDASPCVTGSLPAGTDLNAFVGKHSQAGRSYRLALRLPAGEFELHESWRIDGAALSDRIRHISLSGSPPFTRLSGARDLASLRARISTGRDGIAVIEIPRGWRARLMPTGRYTSEEPGWPTLHDARGAYRLARWPREGWAEFTRPESAPANSIRAGDDAPLEAWRDESAAWVWGFFRFGWHASYAPLAGVSNETRDLTMSGLIRYGVGSSGRYRVLNLRSASLEPGEYRFENTGSIRFRPRDAEATRSIRITVLATPLLMLSRVRSVDVTGIEFAATRGDAIAIDHSTDVDLFKLKFESIGRAGVVVEGGRNVRVRASNFEDLGDQAVILRGGDRTTLEGSGHTVENCRITRPSQRLLTPATAIRLEGVGHLVRGNYIADVPHSAVYFDGNNHTIEANWFERICLEVDDAGAIYAGRDWTARGTVIRDNVFANIHAALKNGVAVAVYLDDMLSGIRVENNAMIDVDYGVLVGGGRDNVIERNLFQRTKMSVHVDERARTWAQKAVAPGEVMEQRLNAMPVRSVRWQAAYPGLAAMPREHAAVPAGNQVRDNLAAATGAPDFVASAAATGTLEPPRALPLPAGVATAEELLEFCARTTACSPFDSRVAARSASGAAR